MGWFINLRNSIGCVVLMAGMLTSGTTQATDYCQPHCYWRTVTVYVALQQPCVDYVVRYDHCGQPYLSKVVTYKTIQIPVRKQLKVCY
ncbi:MAG: hypothetical protein O3C40_29175 [Planctomycetota bacterium]|nr:hypothetical protein [Planctomycetota bacterium]